MIFNKYITAKEFSDDALEILNRNELQNNLFYKNIGDGDDKLMASVMDDKGNVILIAIRTPPHPMLVYETDNIRNDDAVNFFAHSLVENNINVDFIMTEKRLAKNFCEIYCGLTGKDYHNNESLVLYTLNKLSELTPVNGNFRKADNNDMFYLPYWYADFAPACNIGEYNLTRGIDNAEKALNEGNAYVWTDTFPVSLAALVRCTSNCAFIGYVYTPPHLRGKGYSTACVSHLSQKLLSEGFEYCALYADCANPFSNKVYKKIGYKEFFWYDQYKIF